MGVCGFPLVQNLGGDALLGGVNYGAIDVLRSDVWIANFQQGPIRILQ